MINLSKLLLLMFRVSIKAYQYLISPIIPMTCRHFPTCSRYAIEALEIYGPYKGVWLSINRIMRCQPWGTRGYDPVPEEIITHKGAEISEKAVAEMQTDGYTSRKNHLSKAN